MYLPPVALASFLSGAGEKLALSIAIGYTVTPAARAAAIAASSETSLETSWPSVSRISTREASDSVPRASDESTIAS